MDKQAFTVEGDFQMGRDRQHFTLEVVAPDEAGARQRIYTELGSRHGVARRLVRIGKVSPLKAGDASAVTQHRLKQ